MESDASDSSDDWINVDDNDDDLEISDSEDEDGKGESKEKAKRTADDNEEESNDVEMQPVESEQPTRVSSLATSKVYRFLPSVLQC